MNDELLDRVSFPMEDLTTLLSGLHREAPLLLRKIAPTGWDDSPYHKHLQGELDYRYHLHRQRRALQYESFRLKYPHKLYQHTKKVTMDEFRANNYFPPKSDPLLETFALLAEILVVLTELSSIIHGRSRDRCHVEMGQLKDAMDAFVKKEGWFSEYGDRQLHLLQLWHTRCTFDKSPFYEAAFNVLSAHGHGWAYVDDGLFEIASIQEEHLSRVLGFSEPTSADTPEEMEKSISEILASYGAGHIDPLDFPAIFEAVSDHRVPDVVWAFRRVYGELPVGYPMKLADYMF